MEIDPATGALQMTGTGSAKSVTPNLAEITLQFSRARMIQTPAKDLAIQIAKHAAKGVNRFDIRITPPEMGRIQVKLEIAESAKCRRIWLLRSPKRLNCFSGIAELLRRLLPKRVSIPIQPRSTSP